MLHTRRLFKLAPVATRSHVRALTAAASSRFAWGNVEQAPKDIIFGVSEAFNKDTDEQKVNLGVGAYRDDDGKPVVLDCVQTASERIVERRMNNEYLPMQGLDSFIGKALELAYGPESDLVANKQIAAVQSLSGTGALRLLGEFLQRWVPGDAKPVLMLPNPTWGNHFKVFRDAGFETTTYRYYNKESKGLDLDGMLSDINAVPDESIVVLHAVAHNPTGVDPTQAQWQAIAEALSKKGHMAFFDMAYQGFASGDLDQDAAALRFFAHETDIPTMLAQSFAKNMGLYGQRVGCASVVCRSTEDATRVQSQIKQLSRAMYSNPPLHGARIASEVLHDDALYAQWREELSGMASRTIQMRQALKENILAQGSSLNWDHITDQIGMFCYTGLTSDQVDKITKEWHVYMTQDGRISIAGLNTKNVAYVAEAIHSVSK